MGELKAINSFTPMGVPIIVAICDLLASKISNSELPPKSVMN